MEIFFYISVALLSLAFILGVVASVFTEYNKNKLARIFYIVFSTCALLSMMFAFLGFVLKALGKGGC